MLEHLCITVDHIFESLNRYEKKFGKERIAQMLPNMKKVRGSQWASRSWNT